ncbi:MAG: tetratricopeptide repeat protein [Thermoanaerobaculia bacterium]
MKRRSKLGFRTFLRRPAQGIGELKWLLEWMRYQRERAGMGLRLLAILVAVFLLANLYMTFRPGGPEPGDRWWSLLFVSLLAWRAAMVTVRSFWLRPRVAAVQTELLARRGLRALELRLDGRVRRIGERLEALDSRVPELEESLAQGHAEARRQIGRFLGAAPEPADALALVAEREQATLGLDAYRLALGNFEIDTLLEPGYLDSQAAATAMSRAVGLLQPESAATPARAPRPKSSVAVLPFADLSPARDHEYFSAGLAEELINALTRIEELRVIARGSAFALGDGETDVVEVGRRLDVDTVVQGSVRTAGDRLRINVQMVHARDGVSFWSEQYAGGLDNLFAAQDEITAAVVERLTLEVPAAAAAPVTAPATGRQTEILEAYHLYLKGRHFWAKRTAADLRESIDCFNGAVKLDPGYALAWAGLADSHNVLGFYGAVEPQESFRSAKATATRALGLDDDLAEAHCSLAFAKLLFDWDWRVAGEEFERTFELNPGYATAHHWFAEYLALLGRHDAAIEQARTALALDPLSPIINVVVGWAFFYARRYDEAIASLHETLRLAGDFAPAEYWLGLAYEQTGDLAEALRFMRLATEHADGSPMMLAAEGRLSAELGRAADAADVLKTLESRAESEYVPRYALAAIHLGQGDAERSLDDLEAAGRARENWLVFLNIDPVWDRLRSEPRFRVLVREVGLDPDGHLAGGDLQ